MTYEFFNTSYLAFGIKITRAFKSLAQLFDNANKNFQSITEQLSYIGKFIGRNYAVGTPDDPDKPCNCQMIYDILKINPISNLLILPATNDDDIIDGITLRFNAINPSTNKPTIFSGTIHELRATVYARLSTRNNVFSGSLYYDSLNSDEDDKNYNYSTDVKGNMIRLFTYEYNKDEGTFLLYNLNTDLNFLCSTYNRKYSSCNIIDRTSLLNQKISGRKMLIAVTKYENADIALKVKYNNNQDYTVVYSIPRGNKSNQYGLPLYLNDGDIVSSDSVYKLYEVVYA